MNPQDPWREDRHQAWRDQPADEPTPETFKLERHSVVDFLDIGIDSETNLLGNRWLTREGSLFIVAPSGHGKSSLAIQAMIYWALGRIAFGIKPAKPLRILLLESEDDDADNKAFVQVLRTMNLSEAELELLHENTCIEFRRDLTGNRFFDAADQFLAQFPCDVFMINPLTGFCTLSLNDEAAMAEFLRTKLNALMVKHGCAPIIVAHMPKKQVAEISDKQWYEWMYVLQGCVTLTNWARAILVFVPSKVPGTYRFITAKRPAQAGWIQPECYFAHSTRELEINDQHFEVIQWVPASYDQVKEATPEPKDQTRSKRHFSPEEVYARISPINQYSPEEWKIFCKETFGIGRTAAEDLCTYFVDNGRLNVTFGEGAGAAKRRFYSKASPNSSP